MNTYCTRNIIVDIPSDDTSKILYYIHLVNLVSDRVSYTFIFKKIIVLVKAENLNSIDTLHRSILSRHLCSDFHKLYFNHEFRNPFLRWLISSLLYSTLHFCRLKYTTLLLFLGLLLRLFLPCRRIFLCISC